MISFWERESLLQYDVIIIGSGIVGLQTAIQVKEKHPDYDVLILERGLLPSGASTRNAGFAATGSLSELVADATHTPEAALVDLFAKRKSGIDFLRAQLGDVAIGYTSEGSHELLTEAESGVLDYMDHYNQLLKEVSGGNSFESADQQLATFGFSSGRFKHCIACSTEAGLHTGKLIKSLLRLAVQKGVEIKTGAEVHHIEALNGKNEVVVKDGFHDSIHFKAAQVIVCTNAFSSRFFPGEDIQPGRGQVLVTQPIAHLKVKGIFHFDQGYFYFRNVGNRILFGGGRNLDFITENTTDISLNQQIQDHLAEILRTDLLPGQEVAIDMQWSGIMAFGTTKMPIIKSLEGNIHGGFRLGGMGVALGSMVAVALAQRIE
ncbi:MAG: FAD-binding oxidoreductase [Sphingobacteriales bacterium]|nr:MAG: FAD-binding oxidoreductase [Sphingobacteriales bacterium]